MTIEVKAEATEESIQGFLDSIRPSDMRDAVHLREIAAARQAVRDAEQRLQRAVAAARAAGDSWSSIGVMLRMSKQNAHRKFGGTL